MNDVIEATLPRKKKGSRKTLIAVVLDESASMSSGINETMQAFNNYIDEQAKDKDGSHFHLTRFNTTIRPTTGRSEANITPMPEPVLLERSPRLMYPETYRPNGWTPMWDGIGVAMNHVEAFNKNNEYSVLFIIITDGDENASREYTRKHVADRIARAQTENNWTVVFLGADLEKMKAEYMARQLNVPSANTMAYGKMHETRSTMDKLNVRSQSYRASAGATGQSMTDFWEGDDDAPEEAS